MKTTVITTSRLKYLLMLALSLVFVLSPFAIGMDVDDVALQLCIGFFGLCAAIFIWVIINPIRLHLNGEGFRVTGGFIRNPKLVRWRDVEDVFVYRLPRGGKIVGYNFRPGARPVTAMSQINQFLGADGGLPRGWPDSTEQMVDLLNTYRQRALQP